ncbi:hypothetical protein Emed_002685 [Eimeria media]
MASETTPAITAATGAERAAATAAAAAVAATAAGAAACLFCSINESCGNGLWVNAFVQELLSGVKKSAAKNNDGGGAISRLNVLGSR